MAPKRGKGVSEEPVWWHDGLGASPAVDPLGQLIKNQEPSASKSAYKNNNPRLRSKTNEFYAKKTTPSKKGGNDLFKLLERASVPSSDTKLNSSRSASDLTRSLRKNNFTTSNNKKSLHRINESVPNFIRNNVTPAMHRSRSAAVPLYSKTKRAENLDVKMLSKATKFYAEGSDEEKSSLHEEEKHTDDWPDVSQFPVPPVDWIENALDYPNSSGSSPILYSNEDETCSNDSSDVVANLEASINALNLDADTRNRQHLEMLERILKQSSA